MKFHTTHQVIFGYTHIFNFFIFIAFILSSSLLALLSTPAENVKTMFDLLAYSVKNRPNQHSLGARQILKVHKEDKEIIKKVDGVEKKEIKTWNYFELSEYQWMTYKEISSCIKLLGSGLRVLGLEKGQKLCLFAPGRFL